MGHWDNKGAPVLLGEENQLLSLGPGVTATVRENTLSLT